MSLTLVAKKKLTGATFGERLRSARALAKKTQAMVADAVNVNRVTLSQYERNEFVPSFDVVCRLADVLGVSLDALRGESTESDGGSGD